MEKITSENIIDKLRLHPPEQTNTVCMIARMEIEKLRQQLADAKDRIKDLEEELAFANHALGQFRAAAQTDANLRKGLQEQQEARRNRAPKPSAD